MVQGMFSRTPARFSIASVQERGCGLKITLEYTVLIKRTIWRCAMPCSRICRHRDELPGLLPAVCPTCHGPMKLFDTYWLPREESHTVRYCIAGAGEICEGEGYEQVFSVPENVW